VVAERHLAQLSIALPREPRRAPAGHLALGARGRGPPARHTSCLTIRSARSAGRSRATAPGPRPRCAPRRARTSTERTAAEVEAVLRRGKAAVTTLNLAEALDQLHRVDGVPLDRLREVFDGALGDVVQVLTQDGSSAWRVAELRGRHHRRRGSELSLADCCLLAAAGPRDRIVTADPPLLRAAEAERLQVLSLSATG
jgi:hypothetical protein